MIGVELRSDEGLRQALAEVARHGSWEIPVGRRLLAEIRRRAVVVAARVPAVGGVHGVSRAGLADDVLMAAWMVLERRAEAVVSVARPWNYLMWAAKHEVVAEIRAQQALTRRQVVSGRAREVLPAVVKPVGVSDLDLEEAVTYRPRVLTRSLACRPIETSSPTAAGPATAGDDPFSGRPVWFRAFIRLLVEWGAAEAKTVAVLDHLGDLFEVVPHKRWEVEARRDPGLRDRLGLSADQCGALVTLVAGSQARRRAGAAGGACGDDGVLAAVRAALSGGIPVELTPVQLRRLRVYGGHRHPGRDQTPPERLDRARLEVSG